MIVIHPSSQFSQREAKLRRSTAKLGDGYDYCRGHARDGCGRANQSERHEKMGEMVARHIPHDCRRLGR